jgi:NADH-quinone oxidoreductase subunit D
MSIETGELRTEEFKVNVGPQHPSTHGVFRMVNTMDGERIVHCEPHIGFLHRSMEKMAENRQYISYLMMTDRIDYLSGLFCNEAHCRAIEELYELEVPKRAQYIRVMLMELNRIASHSIFWGIFALDLGAITPMLWAFREREVVMDLLEMTTGQRITFSYFRPGGVAEDLPLDNFLKRAEFFVKDFPYRVADYHRLLDSNEIFVHRTKGVGVIPADMAVNYGLTGPNLRCSGTNFDLRKNRPYECYKDFDFNVITYDDGDCYARYMARIYEMEESYKIFKQALEGLPEGDVKSPDAPKKIKPPAGEVYVRVESPRGDYGLYVESDGSDKPYRYKLRTPSFSNLCILPKLLENAYLADMVPIFGSLDVILPDVDR